MTENITQHWRQYLLTSCLLLLPVLASATGSTHQNLAASTEYYADQSGQLTYSQVSELPDNLWARTTGMEINFGFTKMPYWFRFKVENSSSEPQRLLLELGKVRLESVEVYRLIDGQLKKFVSGSNYPFEQRAIKNALHLFPLDLNPGQSAIVYLRVSNSGTISFPMTLWDQASFNLAEKDKVMIFGVFLGIWTLILIFNTVLYAAIPIRALASFIAFVFSFGVYQLISLGVGADILWNPHPFIADISKISAITLAIISLMWFCNHILNLDTSNRVGYLVLQIICYPALLAAASYPVFGYGVALPILTAIAAVAAIAVVVLGVISALKGDYWGLYASIAWTPMLLGQMVRSAASFQLLPMNFMTENAAPAGFILMVLTLSFLITAEYRRQSRLQHEQQLQSNLEYTQEQKKANEKLEEMVQHRTQELQEALAELSQANDTLKEINTMDSLTGIKNRHYFDDAIEQEWKRANRERYPLSLLMLDIDHFKEVNDRYGHLAGDECLRAVAQAISSALKRPADVVARYGGEEFVALLPYIENDNALGFANQIREHVEASTYSSDGHEVKVTLSIGVCTVTPTDDDEITDMISAADIALYEAKNSGRNQVRNAGQLTVHAGNLASS